MPLRVESLCFSRSLTRQSWCRKLYPFVPARSDLAVAFIVPFPHSHNHRLDAVIFWLAVLPFWQYVLHRQSGRLRGANHMTTFTEQFLASSWVAEKRSSIPVLASVLIDADERTVTFTDMDILLILRDVPITGTGKRLFNAERLTSLLKTIAESFQALTLDGDMLVID